MIWKRPKVFNFWCDQIKVLQREVDAEIIPLAVGSEKKVSRELAEVNNVRYYEFKNRPLGRKANYRLRVARSLDPDYILFLGSDDVICSDLLQYQIELANDFDVVEVKDIYYYDTRTKTFVYCKGYTNHRKGEPLAVARLVNAKVFDEIGCDVWDARKSKGIDIDFHNKLDQFKRTQIEIENRFLVLDIKTDDNISTFDTTRDNWKVIPEAFVKKKLGSQFSKLKQL